MNQPEFEPASQEQFEQIKQLADGIVETVGVEQQPSFEGDLALKSATFGIGKSALVGAAQPEALPTLKITKPLHEDSSAHWDYEITYGMQDENQSLHLLIGKDALLGSHGITSEYSETGASDMLSAENAQKLIEDMNTQADQLKDQTVTVEPKTDNTKNIIKLIESLPSDVEGVFCASLDDRIVKRLVNDEDTRHTFYQTSEFLPLKEVIPTDLEINQRSVLLSKEDTDAVKAALSAQDEAIKRGDIPELWKRNAWHKKEEVRYEKAQRQDSESNESGVTPHFRRQENNTYMLVDLPTEISIEKEAGSTKLSVTISGITDSGESEAFIAVRDTENPLYKGSWQFARKDDTGVQIVPSDYREIEQLAGLLEDTLS